MRKKIAMYFNVEKNAFDPLGFFDSKKSVYEYFFSYGKRRGFDMFVASGRKNYLGKNVFKNLLFYTGKGFKKITEKTKLDAIYDRSGGIKFPDKNISSITLNRRDFKIICYNKNKIHSLLKKYMPTSFRIKNNQELLQKLSLFPEKSLVVLKPASGLGGKGIFIDTPLKLSKRKLLPKKEYVLQEFVDTSSGIDGLTKDRHDLRVVVVNEKIVLSHIRTPKTGSLIANAAQGGSIVEVPLNKLPDRVIKAVKEIQSKVDLKFNQPIYSIDFGISPDGKPFVFELNDQIGFPAPTMKNYKKFIRELIHSLEKIVNS